MNATAQWHPKKGSCVTTQRWSLSTFTLGLAPRDFRLFPEVQNISPKGDVLNQLRISRQPGWYNKEDWQNCFKKGKNSATSVLKARELWGIPGNVSCTVTHCVNFKPSLCFALHRIPPPTLCGGYPCTGVDSEAR